MSTPTLLAKVAEYYEGKLAAFGPSAAGVDWNSEASQRMRFQQLLRLIPADESAGSLNDYGCGYGALAEYLQDRHPGWTYCGYDVSPKMIDAARVSHAAHAGRRFTSNPTEIAKSTYTVASGIFNVKLDTADDAWVQHMVTTLDSMAAVSHAGFAFNVLTGYSEPARRRADLFYADPHATFELCRSRFSPRVALLHDYPLFEFTILVRL